MNIFIITMQFPNPREAFASSQMAVLKQLGSSLSMHSYRQKHKEIDKLIAERNLKGIPLSFTTLRTFLLFFVLIIRYPRIFITLLSFILRFHYNQPHHLIKTLILLPRSLELYHQIKEEKPSVVHLYWSHYPALLGIVVRKFLPKIHLTMSLAAYDIRLNYKGSHYLAKRADAVTTICKKNIPVIKDYGASPNKIHLFYTGVAQKYFQGNIHTKKPFSIITAGALIKAKGMDEAILVFEQVQQQFPKATFTILGSGAERPALEKLIADRKIEGITFGGHLSHQQLMAEMSKHELFLFMSHKERIPNVAKEAIANYCYCVVSDTVGIDELIENGISGDIVPVHGIDEAVKAITKAFQEPERVNQAKKIAYDHLKKHFNLEVEMQSYQDMWQALMKNKK
jgi:glycosyltransferase involved in cell wall biosynthesis